MNLASIRISLVLSGLLVATVDAQNASPASSDPSDPTGLWNSDVMMEQATVNIARRYDLDPAQEEFTRQLLRKRTKEFLAEHEDELRGLLKELFIRQLRSESPTEEQAREWGERAQPLLSAAQKAILDGNAEWREILNDKQLRIHDIDLRLMDKNFQTLEERFGRWSQGNFQPGDWPVARAPQSPSTHDVPDVRPTAPPPAISHKSEDYWDIYVKKFIRDYDLDEAQRNSALAVLTDMKQKANRVREQSDAERQAAQEALHQLIREKADAEKIKEASRRMHQAQAPISELFEELRERLARIPTEAQRKRVPYDYIGQGLTTQPAADQSDSTEKKPDSEADAQPVPNPATSDDSAPDGGEKPNGPSGD